MKSIALLAGALLTAGSALAATGFEDRPAPWNDPRNGLGWGENRWNWEDDRRNQHRHDLPRFNGVAHECWNYQAGVWERAREGEYQGDLDYRRCRPMAYEYRSEVYLEPRPRYYYR